MDNIILKKSNVHGTGVYAKRDIKKGDRVIEYVGEKLTKKEGEERATSQLEISKGNPGVGAVYVFELNKKYDVDGNVDWNPARFINHSCDPNCEAEIDGKHIWIVALRDIKKGEEINYNYGYGIDDYEEHKCKCGSKNCIGYILDEEDWPKLKKILKKKGR